MRMNCSGCSVLGYWHTKCRIQETMVLLTCVLEKIGPQTLIESFSQHEFFYLSRPLLGNRDKMIKTDLCFLWAFMIITKSNGHEELQITIMNDKRLILGKVRAYNLGEGRHSKKVSINKQNLYGYLRNEWEISRVGW